MDFYQEELIRIKQTYLYVDAIYERIEKAKSYMDHHYEEALNINTLAISSCFTKFHFIRLFTNIYGMPPYRYLLYFRIKKAKELLRKGYTVSQTCTLVGYTSHSSYTGLFKKITGYNPIQLREK